MSCRCEQCDWPIKTKQTVRIKCVRCNQDVICGEGPLPQEKPPQCTPPDKWPTWALAVAKLKAETDSGVGDTVARYAAMVGGEAFKVASKAMGIPCGCDKRQEQWNQLYPY